MSGNLNGKCCKRYSETIGRYVEALEDIAEGEVILAEKPVLVIPQWDSVVRCSNCFQQSIKTCSKCKIFPLCMSCSNHLYSDCEFFEKFDNVHKNFLIENFSVFGPLKCLLLSEHAGMEETWSQFLEMESHIEERRNTDVWREHEKNVVEPLLKSGVIECFKNCKVDAELLQTICGILDVNTFEIRGPDAEPLRGVYISAALLAHDCVANTMICIDGHHNMKIYATMPIRRKEVVYYNYTNPLLGTAQRKAHLKIGKYFDCTCKRCQDPTELGSYMSALTCGECKGYVLCSDSKWTCEKCSKTTEDAEVAKILSNANDEILKTEGDIRQMEVIIAKYTPILNPNHYLVIDLKQNLASILRSICLNAISKPGKPVLERKLQLCEEIFSLLKIIQPGISRLKAIAIYEYFLPLVELAKRNYEDSSITPEEYLSKLRKGENLLKEALQMLMYEPGETPEGLLAKRAFQEMKQLRVKIDELCAKIDQQRSI